MKRNYLNLTIGLILLLVFVALLFCFQVRQTQVALVTTFGKPSRTITEAGLFFKLPWPIQKVQTFDKRIQSFEEKFEDTLTKDSYGIDIRFLGIKQLGLPESITQKVFDRMKEERQRFVQKLQADGEAKASDIRSAANRERSDILTKAEAEVTELRGKAEAEAAKSLAVFKENPELAV